MMKGQILLECFEMHARKKLVQKLLSSEECYLLLYCVCVCVLLNVLMVLFCRFVSSLKNERNVGPKLMLCFVSSLSAEEADYSTFGTNSLTRKKPPLAAVLLRPDAGRKKPAVVISLPRDFRPVSSIIDVDVLPETHRRVRLYKHGQEKPLGFYIRDGSSVRVTPHGLEKAPGIFISRMVPGGLAESTGLLAVNDEVLEVNGIEVAGKSLDQVTDMMIANSYNLIITVKPANQRNNVVRHNNNSGGAASGSSGRSSDSGASYYSYTTPVAMVTAPAQIIQNFHPEEVDSDEDDEDLVIEAAQDSRLAPGPGTEASSSMSTLPRYKPHLDLRHSNGTFQHPVMSSTSAESPRGPDRGVQTQNLEEDGTVITL